MTVSHFFFLIFLLFFPIDCFFLFFLFYREKREEEKKTDREMFTGNFTNQIILTGVVEKMSIGKL